MHCVVSEPLAPAFESFLVVVSKAFVGDERRRFAVFLLTMPVGSYILANSLEVFGILLNAWGSEPVGGELWNWQSEW
jgi:hypothetical protein